jgi:UbiD family decarboxylase
LRSLLRAYREQGDLAEIDAEVDPVLELPEIHRRVIAAGGPCLLFNRVKGSKYRVVTNLYGTPRRTEVAFGEHPREIIRQLAAVPESLLPPSLLKLWDKRRLIKDLLNVGIRSTSPTKSALHPIDLNLESLPVLKSWPDDGGRFITLPLVYTEHPTSKIHNLGMYRLQVIAKDETGLHMQIGKGGGFHLAEAKGLETNLPVNVFLGGPPSLTLAAIAPLPENIPELLFASLVLGSKLELTRHAPRELPYPGSAEFVLIGKCNPNELKPEGPFGDHYGYYSLKHDFPRFRITKLLARPDAIYPATIVGKPRQEDFYIGDYLQEMLSPLFPLAMPTVKDLWSYGETGFHSLAAAVVTDRYRREAMVSAFRILGEGQLSLTKFLLLTDRPQDLKNFKEVISYILERVNFGTDLYVFGNTSMDTLDYAGPKLNEGSKGVLMGLGDPIRKLPVEFVGAPSRAIAKVLPFCSGVLVVEGADYASDPGLALKISNDPSLSDWPLVVLADDAEFCAGTTENFLWNTFTRFEPARDIHPANVELNNLSPRFKSPVVIDARMKPWYPAEVEVDTDTKKLVDRRWSDYKLPRLST